LLEAVDKYDPTQNASFATYASYRIRGAVLNGVEKTSERTAQYGFKRRVRRERLESLSKGTTEAPQSDLFMEMVDAAIGLALGYMLEDSGMYHHGDEVAQHDDPYKCLEIKRLKERFRFVVEALPEKEKLVVQYHYFQGINFNVIADMLGVTKGRVSQIHSRALRLIRDAYKSLDQFDVKY
jgi:RNA polymerase sigma factor for flagellar operon FliA